MSRGKSLLSLLSLLLTANFSVGCLSNKKEEVAVEAAAPPPAAYPSTPEGYAGTGSGGGAPASSHSAPPAAPDPQQFTLREGETLVTYRIELGDNLSKIANKYNSSVTRIKAANGLTSDRIFAGKTLQIPTAAPPGLAMNAPTTPAVNSNSYGSSGGRYGNASTTTSPSAGSYGSTAPVPSGFQSYPSTTSSAPAPSAPASTSYPRVASPPIPPQTQQPAGAFPTPNFGSGSSVQFSE